MSLLSSLRAWVLGGLAATIGRTQSDPRPASAEGRFQFFDWLLSGGVGWGGSYDSNVNATPINQQSVYGLAFQPSLLAERNTGIQRTTVYLAGDVRYYPSIGRTNLDGIGSDLISLFRGEIFGGYLSQRFDNPAFGTVNDPVFGGRLSWYPTRFITLTVSADQSFGTTDFNAFAFTPGSATKITTENFNAAWDFSTRFAFTAGVSNKQQDYLNSFRRDDFLALTAGVTYKLRPDFGIQFGYAHQHLYSNFPGAPYSRDLVTIGGNTKF